MNTEEASLTAPTPSFFGGLLGTFRYPFNGEGLYLIIGGAVFFTIADVVSRYASIMGILVQVVIVGFLATYAKDVVRTSAMGEERPPQWSDFSEGIQGIFAPFFELLIILAISFGPVIFLQFKHPFTPVQEHLFLALGFIWGVVTLPILFLSVAMSDSITALLNPVPLIRAVWATLPSYLLTCCFFGLMLGISYIFNWLQQIIQGIPILPGFIEWLITLYLVTVIMRSFGLLYRFNHDRLQWY